MCARRRAHTSLSSGTHGYRDPPASRWCVRALTPSGAVRCDASAVLAAGPVLPWCWCGNSRTPSFRQPPSAPSLTGLFLLAPGFGGSGLRVSPGARWNRSRVHFTGGRAVRNPVAEGCAKRPLIKGLPRIRYVTSRACARPNGRILCQHLDASLPAGRSASAALAPVLRITMGTDSSFRGCPRQSPPRRGRHVPPAEHRHLDVGARAVVGGGSDQRPSSEKRTCSPSSSPLVAAVMGTCSPFPGAGCVAQARPYTGPRGLAGLGDSAHPVWRGVDPVNI